MRAIRGSSPICYISAVVLAGVLCVLDTHGASAQNEQIKFPFNESADLGGLTDAIWAFRDACLRQPWSEDLPKRLLPKDYKIVSRDVYVFGQEVDESPPYTYFLSRTGDANKDMAGGHPVIHLGKPHEGAPGGICTVSWRRPWTGVRKDNLEMIRVNLGALTFSRIAFELQAIPGFRTSPHFFGQDEFSDFGPWLAPCYAGACSIRTSWRYDKREIDVTLSLERVNGDKPDADDPKE